MADVAKGGLDRVSPALADRAAAPPLIGVEGDRVRLGLLEVAAVQKGPLPRVGISIGLIDAGRVTILTDAVPAPPGRLILAGAQWA